MNSEPLEPPIVCTYFDDGTVRVFRTVSEAEVAVEGIDIQAEDVAYDRQGRLLGFEVTGLEWGLGHVRLRSREAEPTHREEMEAHLRRHFRAMSQGPKAVLAAGWAESASLEQMLAKGLEFEAEDRRRGHRLLVGCLAILAAVAGFVIWKFVL